MKSRAAAQGDEHRTHRRRAGSAVRPSGTGMGPPCLTGKNLEASVQYPLVECVKKALVIAILINVFVKRSKD